MTRSPEQPSETVRTALGEVEVARAGTGPPVLVLHGTPGGSDSSTAMGRFLVDAGFEVIAPPRPGYLSTPLGDAGGFGAQAELMAAMLDALGCPSTRVLTYSGGGPCGYLLAARHPDRVTALAAFAAVSMRYESPHEGLAERLVMETRPGNWLLGQLIAHAPGLTISSTLGAEGDVTKAERRELTDAALRDGAQREVVLGMARAVADHARRRTGIDNDREQFGLIESLELERIAAPTLLVHGDADTDVPLAHSEHAAVAIAGSELLVQPRGTHLSLYVHPGAADAQRRVVELFRS